MGTPANLEALAALGATADAAPGDVVIAVDAAGATDALDGAERELARLAAADADERPAAPPRSLRAAARRARRRERRADLGAGRVRGARGPPRADRGHARVPVLRPRRRSADEVELKRRGAERGLLVMGPGCGTAMLGGVGLGFANVVRAGPVGIVAAAGTGAQEAAVLLDRAGVGVSQIVGVGGRDLSAEVGGMMFRAGDGAARRRRRDRDAAARLQAAGARGRARARRRRRAAASASSPRSSAGTAARRRSRCTPRSRPARSPPRGGAPPTRRRRRRAATPDGELLGLFSGGSLAHEAETILGPRPPILDLGEEEYTQGRPHPMVDLERAPRDAARRRPARPAACCSTSCSATASHADPAGALAPTLADLAAGRPVIAHVCGTPRGPAGRRAARRRRCATPA